jgi:dipeptidyl aminopeptidase/acylaminoacyl peptidase
LSPRTALTVILFCAAPLFAQSERAQIEALYQQQEKVQVPWQATLSSDASHVAYSVWGPAGRTESVYISSTHDPAHPLRVTAATSSDPCHDSQPAWSHHGSSLIFLSDCRSPGQTQLFLYKLNSSEPPRQLTHLAGFLSRPRWSPDDSSIALLFVDQATRNPNPMAAENRAVGVIDELANRDVQRLTIINPQTAAIQTVSPRDLYVFEYDWSPDSQKFAYTAALPPGDDNWYIAQLYTQSAAGSEAHRIYRPKLQIALPRWSPNGKSIAFIEGLMSDQGGTGGEIYTIPALGGTARDLTPACSSTPAWFTWLSDDSLLVTEFTGGSTAISRLNLTTHATETLWHGPETIRAEEEETSLSVIHNGSSIQTALIRTSWNMLPEVWAGPVGHWRPVTHMNTAVQLPLPRFENVTWQNGGYSVQGWLLFPENFEPTKKYPLLMAVHGGPAWITTPEWRAADFDTTLFAHFGYFVFFPNARGSYGEGERFTQANRRDWGFGDLSDMLAGLDAVIHRYPVDAGRLGLLGWSYGGSTAMMAITQTHRFRAVVAGAGAGNWQSYYGQNSIDRWMLSYFGASVYDDPAAYQRVSALTYIKNARTPALILVGERDGEAPPPQSFEFWHALKELGVPTELVVYAGEGHAFYRLEDRIDVTARTLEWFNRYLTSQ